MPGDIEVFDNAVPPQLVETLDEIVRMPIWKHGVKSSPDDPLSFWFAPFADSEPALEKFSPELFALWLCAKRLLKGEHRIELAYANGQTYGQSGEIHTDTNEPGRKTVVFYCNRVWQPNWHGETLFYTPDHGDVIRAVLPKPGRIVIFDSDIPHAGRDPSRLCPLIRVTITFKLQPAWVPVISPPATVAVP
ncbi:MAG TPA: 2OG-Fe(II) oxygenase [Alphaproteobacteria bacterium]|nr:2OG-Fe(II) oxygenase [Alphaproteobacteria bacterium]